MSGAVALVFPSLDEGFGLPLVEAMACGCPVVSSAVSAIPDGVPGLERIAGWPEVMKVALRHLAELREMSSAEQFLARLATVESATLTDDYWIHGALFADNVKTIWNGVPEKGMITWRNMLKPNDVFEVASYIYTLRGTHPPNPKPPENLAPVNKGPSEFE